MIGRGYKAMNFYIEFVFIPDNFDVYKFIHLVKDEMNELLKPSRMKSFEQLSLQLEMTIKQLVEVGMLYTNRECFYLVHLLMEMLELKISEVENEAKPEGLIININSPGFKDAIERISSGGWGIKHGGWGVESKGGLCNK